MKRIAMGSWAYAIGPYEKDPIDFDTVAGMGADLWGQKLINTDDPQALRRRVRQDRRFLPGFGHPHAADRHGAAG